MGGVYNCLFSYIFSFGQNHHYWISFINKNEYRDSYLIKKCIIIISSTCNLKVRGVKLHVAFFFHNHLLHLVAVLLVLILALLPGNILAGKPLLYVTLRLDGLLFALVADLPGLLLAVLGVAVLLGLLRASLHLHLADLLGLEVTVLLLNWEGEDVGELLAVPVDIGLAHLHLDLRTKYEANVTRN